MITIEPVIFLELQHHPARLAVYFSVYFTKRVSRGFRGLFRRLRKAVSPRSYRIPFEQDALGFYCRGHSHARGRHHAPRDYVEGTYMVTHDDAGNEVHTRVGGPIAPREQDGAAVEASPQDMAKQGNDGYYAFCFCSHKLNTGDADAAVADLKSQFPQDKHYDGAPNYYSIRGSVVAYACNVKGKIFVKNATPLLIAQMLEKVSNQCGRYVGVGACSRRGRSRTPGRRTLAT
ncbi:hypothetical protein ACCO45_011327 [Purpureocillium lilacinum]|uniref:Uncharacterized protein n=1 Tax=Purpureocillium lilacinum TaxID=33203 RepID=A0ACC4DIT4_PURLI